MSANKAAAILVAAGQGERLALSTAGKPKQFSELAGVPLFIWSLTTFVQHPEIEQMILVVPEGWQDQARSFIKQFLLYDGDNITIIAGGITRQESVWLALEKLALTSPVPLYVMIHDAARPFVTTGSIDQILETLGKGNAVTLGIPLSDSIKRIESGKIIEDVDRNTFILVQTPQAAEFNVILKAHQQARLLGRVTTDDAGIIRSYGLEVTVILGSRMNLKITEPEDLVIAQALIKEHNWSAGKITTAASLSS